MRELDDGLAVVTVRAELGEVDALDAAGTNAAYACRDLVHLAAHAQSGRGREGASAATMRPRPQPIVADPARCPSVAAPRKMTPTMFAKRGGRLSSIGPSPKRGCSTSK